jgi:rhamnosyltransferase
MQSSVCAIIVTYCIGKDVLKCYGSIKDQVKEVVVVDNGSDSETVSELKLLEATCSNVTIFYNRENLGIATAINIGARYAVEKGYRWILTLDHDSIATPGMVDELLDAFNRLSEEGVDRVGILAPIPFDTNIQKYLIDSDRRCCGVQEVERVISSGCMIKTRIFEDVGFFTDELFMYYVDDDFCMRCVNDKWRIYLCHSTVLMHQEGAREVKRFFWKKINYRRYDCHATYYRSRNAIYMLKKRYRQEGCSLRVFRITCVAAKRMCFDAIKIILFEKQRLRLLSFIVKGVSDGFVNRYGKLVV